MSTSCERRTAASSAQALHNLAAGSPQELDQGAQFERGELGDVAPADAAVERAPVEPRAAAGRAPLLGDEGVRTVARRLRKLARVALDVEARELVFPHLRKAS